MASKKVLIPLQPECTYHIYNRGNNKEDLFREARNYRRFLDLYVQHVLPTTDLYAYCLLRNHFHLLVRVKPVGNSAKSDANRAFTSMFQAYAMSVNKTYGRTGKLFQEHFGRIEVTDNDYFRNLVFYIHFNPQKHGFVQDFRDWPWSSYNALMGAAPTRIARNQVMDWFEGKTAFESFHNGAFDESKLRGLLPEDFD